MRHKIRASLGILPPRIPVTQPRFVRVALAAGVVGPVTLAIVIVGLTLVQYRFLRGLGWHPLLAPTTDWPSGLALGPCGGIMIAAFVVGGALLVLFSYGARQVMPAMRLGTTLLGVAGTAMALLGFKADPTFRVTPATIPGLLHDIAFAMLGVGLIGALVASGLAFRRDPAWRRFARYTFITAAVALPAFLFKGLIFYLFLFNTLGWITALAHKLRRSMRDDSGDALSSCYSATS